MRRSFLSFASLALVAAPLVACGPDPLLGTYSYTSTAVTNFTQPTTTSQTNNGTGTVTVTAGADYSVDFVASGETRHCVLTGTRNGSGMLFAAGQSCMLSSTMNGTQINYTATLTNGNGVLSGTALTITLAYTFSGNVGAIALMGTGTLVLNSTPVSH